MSAIDAIAEAVSSKDRQWFKRNPGRTVRIRPYVPGELIASPGPGIGTLYTLVRQIGPGVRMRFTVYLAFPPADTEVEGHKLLSLLMGTHTAPAREMESLH